MAKAHPSSHACSFIPNTVFLWLVIQLLMTIKPAHKILSLAHRNCWDKPNIWILPPLFQKNKYGRSQLYQDQIFSHTIYLYNRKFDWCLIVHPMWLVWHTYISHWSTHWTADNIPDVPTKRYFFTKKELNNNTRWCLKGSDATIIFTLARKEYKHQGIISWSTSWTHEVKIILRKWMDLTVITKVYYVR